MYRDPATTTLALPPLTPWVKRILLLNLAVWAATFVLYLASGESKAAYVAVIRRFGVTPELWRSEPWFAFWQPLSYALLHAVQPGHLLFNSISLFFFGTLLEGGRGSRSFLSVYVAGALVGGCAYLLIDGLLLGSNAPCIGASGACLAVLVASAATWPYVLVFGLIPLWLVAAVLVAMDFANLLLSFDGGYGGAAFSAHLGGALLGFAAGSRPELLGGIANWFAEIPARRARRRAAAQARASAQRAARIDELLEKVSRLGLTALSAAERKELESASREMGERRRRGEGRG